MQYLGEGQTNHKNNVKVKNRLADKFPLDIH